MGLGGRTVLFYAQELANESVCGAPHNQHNELPEGLVLCTTGGLEHAGRNVGGRMWLKWRGKLPTVIYVFQAVIQVQSHSVFCVLSLETFTQRQNTAVSSGLECWIWLYSHMVWLYTTWQQCFIIVMCGYGQIVVLQLFFYSFLLWCFFVFVFLKQCFMLLDTVYIIQGFCEEMVCPELLSHL